MNIDWSKAPEGFPIWLEDVRTGRFSTDNHDRSSWARDAQGEYTLYCLGDLKGWWAKSREGVDFIVHRKPEQWTGEGLPPVGTVCEWLECNQTGWQTVEIAGYFKNSAWIVPKGNEPLTVFNPTGFRPIRTPEQIKADERLHQVRNVLTTIHGQVDAYNVTLDCSVAIRATVEAMIDAGYRKQEAAQ